MYYLTNTLVKHHPIGRYTEIGMRFSALTAVAAFCAGLGFAQTPPDSNYTLALADHKGQLQWTAPGFKILQSSAKANGQEIGVRARDTSGRLTLLGFLFLVPDDAPLTGAKCRDGALEQEKKSRADMKILGTSELTRPQGSPLALASYTWTGKDGAPGYTVRGFLGSGDLCGDLEFDSARPISADDGDLKGIFSTYKLDPDYAPQFRDVVLYAQLLYQAQSYRTAAAVLQKALTMLPENGAPFPSAKIAKRVVTEQAAMAYGLSGDVTSARAILALGISEDPDYPMYYYNLACADAAEKKLADARRHLQQAFERKANLNPGETMPDPSKDESFLPYQANKEFWLFVLDLQKRR
jgi:tetratricopeptide (TPR) repeat protein